MLIHLQMMDLLSLTPLFSSSAAASLPGEWSAWGAPTLAALSLILKSLDEFLEGIRRLLVVVGVAGALVAPPGLAGDEPALRWVRWPAWLGTFEPLAEPGELGGLAGESALSETSGRMPRLRM